MNEQRSEDQALAKLLDAVDEVIDAYWARFGSLARNSLAGPIDPEFEALDKARDEYTRSRK